MTPAELERFERKTLKAERLEILFGLLLHCHSLQDAIIWLIYRLLG